MISNVKTTYTKGPYFILQWSGRPGTPEGKAGYYLGEVGDPDATIRPWARTYQTLADARSQAVAYPALDVLICESITTVQGI